MRILDEIYCTGYTPWGTVLTLVTTNAGYLELHIRSGNSTTRLQLNGGNTVDALMEMLGRCQEIADLGRGQGGDSVEWLVRNGMTIVTENDDDHTGSEDEN